MVPSKAPERSKPKKALANLDQRPGVRGQSLVQTPRFWRYLDPKKHTQEVFGRVGESLNKALLVDQVWKKILQLNSKGTVGPENFLENLLRYCKPFGQCRIYIIDM